jgi:hypothetical protein
VVLSGRIISSNTGGGVSYANVQVVDNTGEYLGMSTQADSAGWFSLSSPNLGYDTLLLVSSAEYVSQVISANILGYDMPIQLQAKNTALPEISITAPATNQQTDFKKYLPWLAGAAAFWFLFMKNKR